MLPGVPATVSKVVYFIVLLVIAYAAINFYLGYLKQIEDATRL